MFGTNDSKTYQWNYNDFLTDYTDLINIAYRKKFSEKININY